MYDTIKISSMWPMQINALVNLKKTNISRYYKRMLHVGEVRKSYESETEHQKKKKVDIYTLGV